MHSCSFFMVKLSRVWYSQKNMEGPGRKKVLYHISSVRPWEIDDRLCEAQTDKARRHLLT